MGIFWDDSPQPQPAVVQSFRDALALNLADVTVLNQEAESRALAAAGTTTAAQLNVVRLVVALSIPYSRRVPWVSWSSCKVSGTAVCIPAASS